jgi:hypothetical protein
VPFNTIDLRRKPKVVDWLNMQRTCVYYVFFKIVPEQAKESFFAMVAVLNELLELTADYDPDADDRNEYTRECREVQRRTAQALTMFERDFPKTEMTPCIHWIIHIAGELVPRWNSVRNYWQFLGERFVGWMKTFIHNRTLALANMVRYNFAYPSSLFSNPSDERLCLFSLLANVFANAHVNVCF